VRIFTAQGQLQFARDSSTEASAGR